MALFASLQERFADGQPPLRVTELAEAIGCSRSYVLKLIQAGALEAGRVGRDYRIPVQEATRIARDAGALRE